MKRKRCPICGGNVKGRVYSSTLYSGMFESGTLQPKAEIVADEDESRTGVAGAAQPTPAPTLAQEPARVSSTVQEAIQRGVRDNAGVASDAEREVAGAVAARRRDAPANRQQRLMADQRVAADSATLEDTLGPVIVRAELRARTRQVADQNRSAVRD